MCSRLGLGLRFCGSRNRCGCAAVLDLGCLCCTPLPAPACPRSGSKLWCGVNRTGAFPPKTNLLATCSCPVPVSLRFNAQPLRVPVVPTDACIDNVYCTPDPSHVHADSGGAAPLPVGPHPRLSRLSPCSCLPKLQQLVLYFPVATPW